MLDWNHLGTQAGLMMLALLLGGTIGVERQVRRKAAGVRTYAVVALGSCLFTLVSVYGFVGLVDYDVVRDPSRTAAQIVTGIGFLGAGVIFVNRDVVRGLTTAASIWLAAAIGMACGAGMVLVAIIGTLLYLFVVFILGTLSFRLPDLDGRQVLLLTYADGAGILRSVMTRLTEMGCGVAFLSSRSVKVDGERAVTAEVQLRSGPPLDAVIDQLHDITGVLEVRRRDAEPVHDD